MNQLRSTGSFRIFMFSAACLALLMLLPGTLRAGVGQQESPGEREIRTDRRVVVLSSDEGPRRQVMLQPLSGAYLGVELSRLTPELRIHFGVPDDRGVLVARVEEDSPAAEAGLAVGDIVTAIDGEPIESPWDLSLAIRRHEGGDTVDLEVWREGSPLDFAATLGERERRRIEVGRLLEEGRMEELEELPRLRWFEGRDGEGGPSTVWVDPRMAEDLGKTLQKIELPPFDTALRERNRELEKRLKALEERLRELERRLDETPRR